MVVSGDLGKQLNLNAVAIGLGLEYIEYELKQFPGLVYRYTDLKTVMLFASDKVIITGGNQVEDAEDSITQVYLELAELGLTG